jgi:hypothetical protein
LLEDSSNLGLQQASGMLLRRRLPMGEL